MKKGGGDMIRLRDHLSRDHMRASRMLGRALHCADAEIWLEADIVWRARLTPKERAAAAYSLLKSLDAEDQQAVVETLFGSQGMPIPPLLSNMEEAADWAFFAEPEQRKATALACFDNMLPNDQAAFVDHITTRRAA